MIKKEFIPCGQESTIEPAGLSRSTLFSPVNYLSLIIIRHCFMQGPNHVELTTDSHERPYIKSSRPISLVLWSVIP